MKNTNENIESHALGCKVGRAYQIMLNQLASALKRAGLDLTTSEYLILRAVISKEGLQQCEIAQMVGKDKAAVSRCVAALLKRGYVATEAVSHKCQKVSLTDKSKEIQPKIMTVAAERHQALSEIISTDELEIFSNVIDKIIKTD